jgi:hypothetical protein
MSNKLFVSRSDKFEDQYEGTFSEPTFEEIKSFRRTILIFYNTTKLIEKSSN